MKSGLIFQFLLFNFSIGYIVWIIYSNHVPLLQK